MNEQPPPDNIVNFPVKPRDPNGRAGEAAAIAGPANPGGRDDPRTQEALRLVQSFLAIEDGSARAALVALAESLVTHDWLRRTEQR